MLWAWATIEEMTKAVGMSPGKYPDSARLAAYTDAVVHCLERIRGVVAASSTTALPSQFPIDFPVAPVGGSDCVLLVTLSAWWVRSSWRVFCAACCSVSPPQMARQSLS